jgi:TRAP-type C4-dicarboxylate transport system permease small subunit
MRSQMPKPLNLLMKLFDALVVIGMAAMSLMVFLNVVLRYGFNSGIPISVELSRILFVWVIMLGSIAALAEGAHLAVDSFVAKMPKAGRIASFLVAHALMLWCCLLLWQGSWVQTALNWKNHAALSGLSVGLVYAAGLAAALFMAVCLLFNLYRFLRGDLPDTWAGNSVPAEQAVAVPQVAPVGPPSATTPEDRS